MSLQVSIVAARQVERQIMTMTIRSRTFPSSRANLGPFELRHRLFALDDATALSDVLDSWMLSDGFVTFASVSTIAVVVVVVVVLSG